MILQSGSISMFVKVSVLSLLPPPASHLFIFKIQFFIFMILFLIHFAAFKVFVVVVFFVISFDYRRPALHSAKVT